MEFQFSIELGKKEFWNVKTLNSMKRDQRTAVDRSAGGVHNLSGLNRSFWVECCTIDNFVELIELGVLTSSL